MIESSRASRGPASGHGATDRVLGRLDVRRLSADSSATSECGSRKARVPARLRCRISIQSAARTWPHPQTGRKVPKGEIPRTHPPFCLGRANRHRPARDRCGVLPRTAAREWASGEQGWFKENIHQPGYACRSCGESPAPASFAQRPCYGTAFGEGRPSRSRSRTQKPWCAHSSFSTT